MANVLDRPWRAIFLALAMLVASAVHLADRASGAGLEIAALFKDGAAVSVLGAAKLAAPSQMTPLPQMAQARCPGGQLVFLSRACGCNGACCRCSRQTPYLNHCTCQCEAAPTACAQGHSAGNP